MSGRRSQHNGGWAKHKDRAIRVFLIIGLVSGLSLPYNASAVVDTTYLDKYELECKPGDAAFLIIYKQDTGGVYWIKRRSVDNNQLLLEGHCLSKDSASFEGTVVTYYESGARKSTASFENNKVVGIMRKYYDDGGALWCARDFDADTLRSYYKSGSLKRIEKIKHNRKSKGKCFNEEGKKIKFTPFEVMPRANYSLTKYLKKNTVYPDASRENDIEGRVLLDFVVNEDGTIGEVEVVRHVSPQLDAEALRVISAMKPWRPGIMDDVPVKVHFKLPIMFKLE